MTKRINNSYLKYISITFIGVRPWDAMILSAEFQLNIALLTYNPKINRFYRNHWIKNYWILLEVLCMKWCLLLAVWVLYIVCSQGKWFLCVVFVQLLLAMMLINALIIFLLLILTLPIIYAIRRCIEFLCDNAKNQQEQTDITGFKENIIQHLDLHDDNICLLA